MENKPKKPAIFFATADQANFPYAVLFWNSMVKFHDSKEIDMVLWTNEKRPEELAKLPKGIKVEDLTQTLADDPMFFYRQKPIIAEPLLDEYELVVGFDVDQIVCDDLSYILETKDYDVATVLNLNRTDPQMYGYVELNQIGISPMEYFNCGTVALRSKRFAHHWKVLCFSPQFDRLRYKEQDILNILCYYGNYNVRCLDLMDTKAGMAGWWGLIVKSELIRAELRDGKIVIPKGEGTTPYPPIDTTVKIFHSGGGNTPNKMNYRTLISNEDVVKRFDEVIS